MGQGHWLLGAIVMVLLGGLGTAVMWKVFRPRDEAAAGIRLLAAASWREFINLVLAAFARQGYQRVVDRETATGDGDFTLGREGEHWLLSCKHASSYVLGKPAVEQLAREIRLANARGGFLVTPGQLLDDARAPAERHRIELLDGQALWQQLREVVRPDQLAGIRSATAAVARRRTLLSWLLALVAGIATWYALPGPDSRAAAPAVPAAMPPGPAAPAETDTAESETTSPLDPSRQREALASAVAALPQVTHALWATRSTLEVHLAETGADAVPEICRLVELYPELSASRIQLTPPAGSGEQVRFRQCRVF